MGYDTSPGTISWTDALQVGAVILEDRRVTEVHIFGSVARGELGHDLDVVLITNDELAKAYLLECRLAVTRNFRNLSWVETFISEIFLPDRYEHSFKCRLRTIIARKIFGRRFARKVRKARGFLNGKQIDLFVFPANWKELGEELWNIDPNFQTFLGTITREAREIKRPSA